MSRPLARRLLAATTITLTAASFVASGLATRAGGPFYFAPPPTKECQGVANCVATIGPWVVVPAHGETTFLIGCPTLFGYLIGGTDARASSGNVRVWFDGDLGAPIGHTSSQGAVLLFHAVSNNGQPGSFQPILGCVALQQKNKTSTVAYLRFSAVPGTAPSSPVILRARTLAVRPFKELGFKQRAFYPARCTKDETFVGSWGAVAFLTSDPPTLAQMQAVKAMILVKADEVRAVVQQYSRALLPPPAEVQYGAMCEP